jgi:hypothetical protein
MPQSRRAASLATSAGRGEAGTNGTPETSHSERIAQCSGGGEVKVAAVRHAVTEANRADDRGLASVAHPPARGDAVFLAHESADLGSHAHYVTFECLAPHEAR